MFDFDKLNAKWDFFVRKGNFTPSDPPDTSVVLQAKTIKRFQLSCVPVDTMVARVGRLLRTVFLKNTRGYQGGQCLLVCTGPTTTMRD